MIKAQVHPKGSSKANGTALLDRYLKISYDELIQMFGKPLGASPDNKTQAEWHVSFFENGVNSGPEDAFVTIYDYKHGVNVQDIENWHVGGKRNADRWMLDEYIKQHRRHSREQTVADSY